MPDIVHQWRKRSRRTKVIFSVVVIFALLWVMGTVSNSSKDSAGPSSQTLRTTAAGSIAQVAPTTSSISTTAGSSGVSSQVSDVARTELYVKAQENAFGAASQEDVDKLGNGVCADLKPSWDGASAPGLAYFQERDRLERETFTTAAADIVIQDAVIGYCPEEAATLMKAMTRIGVAVQSTSLGVMELSTK